MVDYSFEPSAEPLNLAPQGRGLGIGVAPLVRISFKRAVRCRVLRSLHGYSCEWDSGMPQLTEQ